MRTTVTQRPPRLLGLGEVAQLIGLSEGSLYRLRRSGQFPAPIRIGRRRVAWLAGEIETWIAGRQRADLSTPPGSDE
jgi:prophage regulatory protein